MHSGALEIVTLNKIQELLNAHHYEKEKNQKNSHNSKNDLTLTIYETFRGLVDVEATTLSLLVTTTKKKNQKKKTKKTPCLMRYIPVV